MVSFSWFYWAKSSLKNLLSVKIGSSLPNKSQFTIFSSISLLIGVFWLNTAWLGMWNKLRHERRNAFKPPSFIFINEKVWKVWPCTLSSKAAFLGKRFIIIVNAIFLLIFWVKVIFIALSFVFVTFLHVPQKIFSDCGRFHEKA